MAVMCHDKQVRTKGRHIGHNRRKRGCQAQSVRTVLCKPCNQHGTLHVDIVIRVTKSVTRYEI